MLPSPPLPPMKPCMSTPCYFQTGWSPLHLACAHGHPKVVEMLIEFGAKLDIQTKVVIL